MILTKVDIKLVAHNGTIYLFDIKTLHGKNLKLEYNILYEEVIKMSSTLFKKIDYSLSKLIADIEHGNIGLPDIQRPFVWKATKVRDLFDSMYKGFPVGYLLFWANDQFKGTRQIGVEGKQHKIPWLLIVDGQQRLTSLYAVLKGQAIVNSSYHKEYIHIAFRPIDARFEVTDAAIRRDPEFIPDISTIWVNGYTSYRLIKEYLENLRKSREISNGLEEQVSYAIDRLFALQNYPFTALEISSSVDEEQVADIFVRINSEGVKLNQADFILTLLSVFWDEGRASLEEFSRRSREIPQQLDKPSPYNHHIHPDPDQLLRVSIAIGFKRGQLKSAYNVLRGKDMETELFSEEERDRQFAKLQKAQDKVLNLVNWHEFLKSLITAGFRSRQMISSQNTLLYAYAFFLIGKEEFKVDSRLLRSFIARWFFMTTITGRYSGSPETIMEGDLARLRGLTTADEFMETLEKIIQDSLTPDFWEITLPNALETSSPIHPGLFAYYAALNILDAPILFSTIKVSQMLDPAIKPIRKAIERHHLFPKGYLKKIGIEEIRITNQVANFALVEWGDNSRLTDQSPQEYFPEYASQFSEKELAIMCRFHALSEKWYEMPYDLFLEKRRKLMAVMIREGFEKIN
ncbi:MAG: DUF262 domain-containing protein [bacterium]